MKFQHLLLAMLMPIFLVSSISIMLMSLAASKTIVDPRVERIVSRAISNERWEREQESLQPGYQRHSLPDADVVSLMNERGQR